MKKEDRIKELLLKLQYELHIDFICKKILRYDYLECKQILDELIENDIIEEKNNYYKLKTKK